MARLIGIIHLRLPRIIKKPDKDGDFSEMIGDIGIDDEGQAWGLVVRQTKLDAGPRPGVSGMAGHRYEYSRLDYDRWVRYTAIPFVATEVVGPTTANLRPKNPPPTEE